VSNRFHIGHGHEISYYTGHDRDDTRVGLIDHHLTSAGEPCRGSVLFNIPQNADWPVAGFGEVRVRQWLDARRKFLSAAGRSMFQNAMLSRCGLAG